MDGERDATAGVAAEIGDALGEDGLGCGHAAETGKRSLRFINVWVSF